MLLACLWSSWDLSLLLHHCFKMHLYFLFFSFLYGSGGVMVRQINEALINNVSLPSTKVSLRMFLILNSRTWTLLCMVFQFGVKIGNLWSLPHLLNILLLQRSQTYFPNCNHISPSYYVRMASFVYLDITLTFLHYVSKLVLCFNTLP